MQVYRGGSDVLTGLGTFDRILANINRNILLEDMASYVEVLNTKVGELYLSGFYLEDLDQLKQACNKYDLHCVEHKERNHWVAAKFVFLT